MSLWFKAYEVVLKRSNHPLSDYLYELLNFFLQLIFYKPLTMIFKLHFRSRMSSSGYKLSSLWLVTLSLPFSCQ